MTSAFLALLAGFGLIVGLLIGSVGIGGVLLVPALSYLGQVEIRAAIAAAMFSYLFTGVIGTLIYAKKGSIRWSLAFWLCAGAMPAAFAGSWVASLVPKAALELVIALFVVFAGANALWSGRKQPAKEAALGGLALAAIGAITGFGSAITGTGGPLVLLPILIWLRIPVLAAVGLSQAVQLPIAALATAGNLIYGQLDLVLGGAIAAGLALGSAVGAYGAHSLSQMVLRRAVAVVLIAVGAALLLRVGAPLLLGAEGCSGLPCTVIEGDHVLGLGEEQPALDQDPKAGRKQG